MFTFLIICFFVWVIYASIKSSNTPDKRDESEISRNRASLPDIALHALNLTTWERTLCCVSKSSSLRTFKYISGMLYLQNALNNSFSCPLASCKVYFIEESRMPLKIRVMYNNKHFDFYKIDQEFAEKDWEIILSVLHLAGSTYGEAANNLSKGLSRANTVMKVIKFLSN